MSERFDACVIGSGAGAGPVAWHLAQSGKRVVVLEKGPWYDRSQFLRDEIVQCRRPNFYPRAGEEPQLMETTAPSQAGSGKSEETDAFWNGSLVGGSSMLMSGFFPRLKPCDFHMATTYGVPEDTQVADWPIGYDDLEPWYARVEKEVGVSGALRPLPANLTDRRSTKDFPLPPTREHPFANRIDRIAPRMGLHPIKLPRAVLPRDYQGRQACDYNGYCGSYACHTGAKGGSKAAWIDRAVAAGCVLRPRSMVRDLETDATGRKVVAANYFDRDGNLQRVEAKSFVVACQAIESARLLLNSKSAKHPRGLANGNGLVGRNLLFSTFGAGWGDFAYADHGGRTGWLGSTEPFVNRVVQDYYWYDPKDPRRNASNTPPGRDVVPGGTINFLLMHPNPISHATTQAFTDHSRHIAPKDKPPLWGQPLKERLGRYFRDVMLLKVEAFGNWWPYPGSYIAPEPTVKDKWGIPVASIHAFSHRYSSAVAHFLVDRGLEVLGQMGARGKPRRTPSMGGPSTNLIAGTCRFGKDPKTSVLDPSCRAWEVDNLYVTDGSFMPTAGRIPFTFTIYANALRVAHELERRLS